MTPEEVKQIEQERKYKDQATDIEVLKNMSDQDFEEHYNAVMSYDGDDPVMPYEKRNVEFVKGARDKLKKLRNQHSKKSQNNKPDSSQEEYVVPDRPDSYMPYPIDADEYSVLNEDGSRSVLSIGTPDYPIQLPEVVKVRDDNRPRDLQLLDMAIESANNGYWNADPSVIEQFRKAEEQRRLRNKEYIQDIKEDANRFFNLIEVLTALYGLGNGVASMTPWLDAPKLAPAKTFFLNTDLYKGAVWAGTGADIGQRILADTPFDKRENEVELLFDAGNLAGTYDLYRFLPPKYDKFGRIVDNVFDKGGYLVNAYDVSKIFW